jgi:DMSO reductase iron-sulfur subunit
MQLGFHVDLRKCVGCRSCEAACDVTWDTPTSVAWRRVGTIEGGDFPAFSRLFLSISCNHCDIPACATACPVKAYTKRKEDGVVVVDSSKCVGCKLCTWACPYGAPQYDPETKVVSKCHFCLPRQAEGRPPRCVETCPYGALDYGPMDELLRRHPEAQRTAPLFPDPSLTRPNILFTVPKDLPEEMRRVDIFGRLFPLAEPPPAGTGTNATVGAATRTTDSRR